MTLAAAAIIIIHLDPDMADTAEEMMTTAHLHLIPMTMADMDEDVMEDTTIITDTKAFYYCHK